MREIGQQVLLDSAPKSENARAKSVQTVLNLEAPFHAELIKRNRAITL
jgi:hypothetical protein